MQPHRQPQYHQPQTHQVPVQQYGAQPGTVIVHEQNTGAQAGAAVGITLIVVVIAVVGIVVLAGVLYVWANSLEGESTGDAFDVDIDIAIQYPSQTLCEPTGITIQSGEYYHCSFSLNGDVTLRIMVDVGSGANVDVYTMTMSNFERFQRGDSFDYHSSLSRENIVWTQLTGDLTGNREYVVVVVNN